MSEFEQQVAIGFTPSAAAIEADVSAPLCNKCENENIYDRSPESCRDCARIRLQAAYAADAPRVAAAIEMAYTSGRLDGQGAGSGPAYADALAALRGDT